MKKEFYRAKIRVESYRINQFLSLCGWGSRRQADALIKEGRVKVNGEPLEDLSLRITSKDNVTVGRKRCLWPSHFMYVLFNKPKGCLCSRGDIQERKTIYDFLPKNYQTLKYAGRLDYNSRGLLLLTDDGNLIQKLLRPENKITRTYDVKLHKALVEKDKLIIEKGMVMENGMRYRPNRIEINGNNIRISLTEGKNREIRNMMEKLGYFIKDLNRESFGPLQLGSLMHGACRLLSPKETSKLIAIKGEKG